MIVFSTGLVSNSLFSIHSECVISCFSTHLFFLSYFCFFCFANFSFNLNFNLFFSPNATLIRHKESDQDGHDTNLHNPYLSIHHRDALYLNPNRQSAGSLPSAIGEHGGPDGDGVAARSKANATTKEASSTRCIPLLPFPTLTDQHGRRHLLPSTIFQLRATCT